MLDEFGTIKEQMITSSSARFSLMSDVAGELCHAHTTTSFPLFKFYLVSTRCGSPGLRQ
jgi:hypothetical protein